MDDAYKAKATPIPNTEKYFEFYSNKRSQLVELVSASSDDNTSAKQPIVPLKDFVNHAANKKDRDSRTVKLLDIPLSFSQDSIHAAMSRYGKVVSVRLNTKNAWQQAFVEFETADSVSPFYDEWGFICLKHFIKAIPLVLPQDQWELRSKYVLKLTGLPPGTTFIDLVDIVNATDAKSCIIPKGLKAYQPRPFAYIAFSSESKMLKALKTSYSLVNSDLTWVITKQKLCGICESPSHLAKFCPKNKTKSNKKYQTIYERYKPANYQKYLPKKLNNPPVNGPPDHGMMLMSKKVFPMLQWLLPKPMISLLPSIILRTLLKLYRHNNKTNSVVQRPTLLLKQLF